ncbi:MAG TPA: hypothetical protein VLE22_11995, partial [Bryobacteraceae bacterium]|nr:hypothetical protein [Bryobacteraceae bacterium]
MSFALSSAPPRRLVALFLALTLAPAAGLVWLGWRLLEQDRALEAQRAQERREYAADLAASALSRKLSLARQRLGQPERAADLASAHDSLVVVFRQQQVEAFPAGRLLFYPFVLPEGMAAENAGQQFRTGEEYEFRHKDFAKAIENFRSLVFSRDLVARAGAHLRLARNYRKSGDLELALAEYGELTRAERVVIDGVPAELVARGSRCALLAELGRSDELLREARVLYEDMLRGRWRLTRPVFQLYASQARGWLRRSDDGERGQLALSDTVERLWGQWQAARAGDRPMAGATVLRV